jgi:hypothetical protein
VTFSEIADALASVDVNDRGPTWREEWAELIGTIREAFKVLTVGKVPVSAVEWQTAFDKLVKALLDPMPRKVEEARHALLRLSASVTLPSEHARRSLQ